MSKCPLHGSPQKLACWFDGSAIPGGIWLSSGRFRVLPAAKVVLFFPVWEDDAVMSRCAVLSLSTEMVSVLSCLATLKNFSPGSSTSNGTHMTY